MYDALTYEVMLKKIVKNAEEEGVVNDTIGILITSPNLPIGKSIVNQLGYFHFRTGNTVNFYLPGYGAYWPKSEYPDKEFVKKIGQEDWFFSDEAFTRFIVDLEKHSSWKYSGESELLLLESKGGILSYKGIMQFHLDKMIRDEVIESVYSFFEQLFRLCRDNDTLNKISKEFRMDNLKQRGKEDILEIIPVKLRDIFTEEKYFCIKDMNHRKS